MRVVISSGHGKYIRGASGSPVPPQCDEVDEARKVVNRTAELLRNMGVTVTTFHDDSSHSQSENLNRIVNFHNAQGAHDWDVSVHFNAYNGTAHGCEVLYVSSTGQTMAKKMVDAMCAASGLTNRGPKKRTDLAFLNGTNEPAVLVETAFCDNTSDCNTYRSKFEDICGAIAKSLSGQEVEAPGPEPEPPTDEADEAIMQIAVDSAIARYSWRDRGVAPPAYMKGFALAWAQVLRAWAAGDPAAVEMAKADTRDAGTDALSVYADKYAALEMNNREDGVDTLRHLYALLLGHGMRESSGKHCCGTDDTAEGAAGRPSDEIEAGLYQTSYNAHTSCAEFDMVTNLFEDGERDGYLDVFADGVTCDSGDWRCYGSGAPYNFQMMCKNQPAYAVETCALVLRNRCMHYGPIKREESELRKDSDIMLFDVQKYVLGDTSQPEGDLEARVAALEATAADHERRITALEGRDTS